MTALFEGVRIARETDEAEIFSLLTLMHAEAGFAPMDAERVLERLRTGTRGRGGVIGVIDGPKGIEASVGLFISQWWYAAAPTHLEENWAFVRPECRKSGHARRLIQFAKWTSLRLGLPLLMGVLTRDRFEAKIRLYQKEMAQVGAIFMDNAPASDFFDQRRFPKDKTNSAINRASSRNRSRAA